MSAGRDCTRAAQQLTVELAETALVASSDLAATDLLFIQATVAAIVDDRVRQIDPQLHRRYRALLLYGVRASDGSRGELCVPPLSIEQVRQALISGRS